MKVSKAGIDFLKKEEGVRTKAYRDSVGVWTIGVGHTAAAGPPAPKSGMVITMQEVDEILARDLVKYENAVLKAVKVPLTQNQFDALVSLCFNIGPGAFAGSTVVKRLNAKDYVGAAEAMLMWKKAGNDPDLLLPRRKREKALFLTEVVEVPKAEPKPAPSPSEPGLVISLLALLFSAFRRK